VPEPCYATVQAAVDAADDPGDVIKVATGVYTGVSARPAPAGYVEAPAGGLVTQVVYITKTVTVRGGYTTAFTDPPDPEANPTTLDAEGQGRVLLVAGDITPTIEGLRITGGDAAGLGGAWETETYDVGGGAYVISATVIIRDNWVFNNTAVGDYGAGGGLLLSHSDAMISENTFSANTASIAGGGLLLYYSDATVSGNTFSANTAGQGGGLRLGASDATISGNTFSANVANYGGGLEVGFSNATLSGNIVTDNTANYGAGVRLWESDATVTNNIVADNQASIVGSGMFIQGSSPSLLHTTIARNTGGDGSGIYVTESSAVDLVNTILVGHSIGIYVAAGSRADLDTTLWGSGAWANTTDRSGPGTINHSDDQTGDPAFVNPGAGDYHIGPGSAAIDAGADAGVSTDIDGHPRPAGMGFDIGADEYYYPALEVTKQATPDPVQPGAPLAYTIYITNVGNVDLHATITDTLPLSVTLDEASGGTLTVPGGTVVLPDGRVAVTWTDVLTRHGGVWMGTIVVTVDEDTVGSLTNLVEVTTKEGVAGEDRVAVIAGSPVFLPLVLRGSEGLS
jgi:uncharacterized repeat protein (TIGR01451 family)